MERECLENQAGATKWLRKGARAKFRRQECRKYLRWEAHEKPLNQLGDADIHPNFLNGNLNRPTARETLQPKFPFNPIKRIQEELTPFNRIVGPIQR